MPVTKSNKQILRDVFLITFTVIVTYIMTAFISSPISNRLAIEQNYLKDTIQDATIRSNSSRIKTLELQYDWVQKNMFTKHDATQLKQDLKDLINSINRND